MPAVGSSTKTISGRPTTRHREAEPLLLAAGEPPVRRPPAVAEPQPVGEQRRCRAGARAGAAMWRSISIARTPLQAPPPCSITPIRGSRSRAVADRVEAEHPDRALLRGAVALAGLQGGGLAGAVGAEHGGDGAAARRSATSPSTATLSPYRITRPSTATAGSAAGGFDTRVSLGSGGCRPGRGRARPQPVWPGSQAGPRRVRSRRRRGLGVVARGSRSKAAGGSRHSSWRRPRRRPGSPATPAQACRACRRAGPRGGAARRPRRSARRASSRSWPTRRCPWRRAG